ncbi:glycosyltransferase family 2 protein [Mongoliibacter ruber]|nr:glycosyltransferase family 2 protein [Mongoliibacter ruber]
MKIDLSVVMPVYNGEKYLREAILSVLNQSFKNFELLIINDGSTDSSVEVINQINDDRIQLIDNKQNRGIAYTRNLGLKLAKGDFLAWMDCDDLIDKDRFRIQINFLKNNPKIGICGTWLERFNEGKPRLSTTFLDPEMVKSGLIFKPSVLNATSMFRMDMITKAGLSFDTELAISEDYNFYVDACFHFPIANIPKKLYFYRASETSIMKRFDDLKEMKFQFHKKVYTKWFEKLHLPLSEENFRKHDYLSSENLYDNIEDVAEAFNWLVYIKNQNIIYKILDDKALDKVLGNMFYFLCKKSSQIGLKTFAFYLKNRGEFEKSFGGSLLKLFLRCFIKYDKF